MKQLQATSCHTLLYVYFTIKLNHVFSNVSSNGLAELMHSHIGYICLTFLHCVFSNESSNCLPERMRAPSNTTYLIRPDLDLSKNI